jgi:energy-coupling factor transporter ATP-binding protein EcfA2
MPATRCTLLIDRKAESLRLHQAIRDRESLLICGPAGVGKTALISKVLAELPEDTARAVILVDSPSGLQPLLRTLLQNLHEAGDAALRKQLRAEGAGTGGFKCWLKNQRTSRLKGAVYRSMQMGRYWIFLDHVPPLTPAMAKVMRELVWMRNTPVYLAARGSGPEEVGHAVSTYWGEHQQLALGPLRELAARELLESCIQRFGLAHLNLDEFRKAVLSMSGCNPGVLVKMCELAADSRYQSDSRIKTRLIHIDYLMSLNGRNIETSKGC